MLDSTPENPYAAGCIRFTDDGPQWHTNTAHIARGFNTDVQPEVLANGRLRVLMITNHPVGAAIATADETLTEREISAGITGAVSECAISLVKAGMGRRLNLGNPADYALVAGEFSNLWLFVQREIAAA